MLRFIIGLWERGPCTKIVLVSIGVEFVIWLSRVVAHWLARSGFATPEFSQWFSDFSLYNRYIVVLGILCAVIALVRGELNPR